MKKGLLTFTLALAGFTGLFAQSSVTGVSMTAENKVVIMEEFTGVRCTYCPDGKLILDGILAANPDAVFAISSHPNNSSLTAPYGADEDLRRTYPNSFYSTPYCGTTRFMPSSFINRRIWAGERLQGRGDWATYVDQVKVEASPVNVGVLATYDSTTKILSVTVEAYYTSTVTDSNMLYVSLSEDNITVQQQSGATGPFVQDLVFREGLASQWGDYLSPTTQGSMVTKTYTFDNTTADYDMSEAKVIAYVENKTTRELYSGWQKQVVPGTATAVVKPVSGLDMNVLPNPFTGTTLMSYYLPEMQEVGYTIHTLQGQEIAHVQLGSQGAGTHNVTIDGTGMAAGIYILKLQAGENALMKRLVIQ